MLSWIERQNMRIFLREVHKGAVYVCDFLIKMPKHVKDGEVVKIFQDKRGFYLVYNLECQSCHQNELNICDLPVFDAHNL